MGVRTYSSARFVRCQRGDAQGVNVGLHQLAERPIDQLMTLQGAQSSKVGGDHAHAKMTSAIARASMAGVQVAVVDQLDLIRMKRALQLADDAFRARRRRHFELPCASVSGGILFASHSPWPMAN